ncbi:MAG: hypothetical protein KDE27_18935, partial [Planctomycetes bacterium]|nr:hypothetical protein [Planctomycetota bacterium]
AVIAGALAAQLVLTLPITTLVARGLGAPAAAAARHELPAPGSQPWLVARDPLLVYDIDLAAEIAAIEVRPLTAPPTGPLEPSLVDVRTPAGDLLGAAIPFDQNGQSARIDLAPQTLPRLELALAGGNVPLFFPAGAVVVVEAAPRSGLANGCIAAALMLLPTFVALAVACLCGAVAAPPTVLTVAFAVIFLLTVGGLGPGDSTLLALLRGDWLPSTGIFAASASSLAAGSVAMIAAMLLRRRLHR